MLEDWLKTNFTLQLCVKIDVNSNISSFLPHCNFQPFLVVEWNVLCNWCIVVKLRHRTFFFKLLFLSNLQTFLNLENSSFERFINFVYIITHSKVMAFGIKLLFFSKKPLPIFFLISSVCYIKVAIKTEWAINNRF